MRKLVSIPCFLAFGLLSLEPARSQTVPPLVNYQGRLTDQSGKALPGGAYTLQFRLWDNRTASGTNASQAPDLIWCEQQSVTVQTNGVFGVILGTGGVISNTAPAVNNLAYAFAGTNAFLGVTVSAQSGTNVLSPGEILPRQQILSVPYAFSAGSAATATLATNAMSVAPGSVFSSSFAPGAVSITNLAPRTINTNAGVGGVAVSPSSGNFNSSVAGSGLNVPVSVLSVTITATGRPIFVGLIADGSPSSSSIEVGFPGNALGIIGEGLGIQRTGSDGIKTICNQSMGVQVGGNANAIAIPSSALQTIDLAPPAGTNTYTVIITRSGGFTGIYNSSLIAFEF